MLSANLVHTLIRHPLPHQKYVKIEQKNKIIDGFILTLYILSMRL